MSGHTPGPWTHYHARLRPQYPVIVNEIHGPAGQVIVQWGGFDAADGSKSVRKANARLIATAPILLQELCGANTQMEMAAECIEAGRYDEALLYVRSMSRSRRAAIAEATGETP